MNATDLETVLRRLQDIDPTSRVSRKRQLLSSARESIIALHRRGYSWRSLARELSAATGESISADLLRAACIQRPQRRSSRRSSEESIAPKSPPTSTTSAALEPTSKQIPPPSDESFGARGLKL